MKKLFKTIFIIILIGGFALFIFWLVNPDSIPTQNNFITKIRDFSPFGTSSQDIMENDFQNQINTQNEILPADRELPNIEMVYSSPVGGYTIINTGTSTTVRVVDRATGHIIDINPITKERVRISNTTLPSITEAIWFNNSNSVILRYVKDQSDLIETLLVSNLKTNGEDTVGSYLEENITDIKPLNSSEIAYVVPQGFGSKINIYNINQNSVTTVLTSTIQEWKVVGSNKSGIYLQTKASYTSPGYIFFLSRKDGSLIKIYSGFTGLNALISGNTSKIFLTTGGSNASSLILDQDFGTTTFSETKTIASKCTYTKDSLTIYCGVSDKFPENMPDIWYMGLTSLNDQIWSIQTDGKISFISNLPSIDVIKPEISENNELFFINKKNGTVWIVRLNQL